MDEQKKIVEENTKKVITEEDNKADIEEWYTDAGKQTFETLPEFIRHVMNDYEHDYGTVCHAIAACAIATAWACNEMDGARGGITGFQAGAVMWQFIRRWSYKDNKCGLRIINYDNLLYPQYESYFGKTIGTRVWNDVQKQAKENLAIIDPFTSKRVVEHWRSIAAGNVPFGLTVSDD